MKKLLLSLSLCLGLTVATTPRSHATAGFVMYSGTIFAVGGLIAAAGFIPIAIVDPEVPDNDPMQGPRWVRLAFIAFVAGAVILEGEQEGEIAFARLSGPHAGFSAEDVATYNRELPRLNAIQQTISAEANANPRMDTRARWETLGSRLSPVTMSIAAHSGQELLRNVRVQNN